MLQTDDESASLVRALNSLLRELDLQTLEVEVLNDLTPSLLLIILESLLRERLPISKSIRESRNQSARVDAMKIFLGVLSNDLLVQRGFGDTVINEVAEIDPRKLAHGEHEECFVIGEVLCRFAKSYGLLRDANPSPSTRAQPEQGSPEVHENTPSPIPRAPSPFSVSNISPPSNKDQGPSSPSTSKHKPATTSSHSTSTRNFNRFHTPPSTLTPVRRTEARCRPPVNPSPLPPLPPPSPNESQSERSNDPPSTHEYPTPTEIDVADDRSTNDTVVVDPLTREYHATTTFFAESSMEMGMGGMLSPNRNRNSTPSQSFCTCDGTLASEADTSFCACAIPPLGLDADDSYSHIHPHRPSESALPDEENPFLQFSESRIPLDLFTSGRGLSSQIRTTLAPAPTPGQTYIEDRSIYAHPTLIRTAGLIEQVGPDNDFEEFLRSHPQARSYAMDATQISRIQTARLLGPMKHSSPSGYRLALLRERARLYAEIARARQEAATEAY